MCKNVAHNHPITSKKEADGVIFEHGALFDHDVTDADHVLKHKICAKL